MSSTPLQEKVWLLFFVFRTLGALHDRESLAFIESERSNVALEGPEFEPRALPFYFLKQASADAEPLKSRKHIEVIHPPPAKGNESDDPPCFIQRDQNPVFG